MLKVLYDYQVFVHNTFGGVPRYIVNLISEYNKNHEVFPQLPKFWNTNADYLLQFQYNRPISWTIRDKIVKYSKKLTNRDVSVLLNQGEKASIKALNNGDFDVFHPTHFKPYFLNNLNGKPYVITVHDLTVEKFDDKQSQTYVSVVTNTRRILDGAARCIAITENTKKDLINYYGIDADMIDVVYHGNPYERYQIPKLEEENSLSLEDIRKPYLLYVGGRYSYKNFIKFLESIIYLLQTTNLHLICVGSKYFSKEELKLIKQNNLTSKVIIYTNVDDLRLISLYQHAIAFVFPSLNEGFGLPVLEAFACGCPVICSNNSSFPEVAGTAAEMFDPMDSASIADACQRVVYNIELRNAMRIAGYKQLEYFSWRKTALETKNVYEKALTE